MNPNEIPFRSDTDIPDPSVMSLTDEQMVKYNEHIRQAMSELGRPNRNGPIIRALDQRKMIQAANGGFPKMMFHTIPGIAAQEVYNDDQERVLIERGFSETYTFQQYPRMLYRQNLSFASNGEPRYPDFIETKVVKDSSEEAKYLRLEESAIATRWTIDASTLPPPPGAEENKDLQIARLEGELIGVRTSSGDLPRKPPQKAQSWKSKPKKKPPAKAQGASTSAASIESEPAG